MTNSTVTVRPISAALGAEVTGLRLRDVGPNEASELAGLLAEHLVLFFPDQHLSQREHVDLGHLFGPLEGHPQLKNPYPDFPEIFELSASLGGIADEWHTDLTFLTNPSVMSILNMVKCPAVGGDTMWANTALAFEALSPPLQDLLSGLTALHDEAPHGKPDVTAIHPVVRTHPVTGRRCLYVNEHFTRRIVELSAPESDALLGFLTAWVSSERFTVRHRWAEGTIAMWDNRATQHFVVNDFTGERVIQRVTVMGDLPAGDEPRWPPFAHGRGATTRHDAQLIRALRARATDR